MNTYTEKPKQNRKLRITLPCEVQQIDPRTIEAIVEVYNEPVVYLEAIDAIAMGMSDIDKDKLIEDTVDFMQSEAFKRRIVVS